jgi:GH25 family lysozyme M1 (1,4-beta-N-acetylmuramidase)
VTLGKKEINAFTVAFCQTIEAAGYPTGIYTNLDYYKNYYTKATLSKWQIWLADYSGDPDFDCVVHQYSSSGTVSGISAKVDMKYCYLMD